MKEPIPVQNVQSRIYRIRGKQVMLDSDLATLYGVETFNLNKAVKRNIRRFPEDFMIQLTPLEWERLTFQIGISKPSRGGRRYSPYAFTEQGVAMLSSVLSSDRAIDVNIAILRAFVKLRHAVLVHQGIARKIEKLEGTVNVLETDVRLLVLDVDKLKKKPGIRGPVKPTIL